MANLKRFISYKTAEKLGKVELVSFCLGIIMSPMFTISYFKWSMDTTLMISNISVICWCSAYFLIKLKGKMIEELDAKTSQAATSGETVH